MGSGHAAREDVPTGGVVGCEIYDCLCLCLGGVGGGGEEGVSVVGAEGYLLGAVGDGDCGGGERGEGRVADEGGSWRVGDGAAGEVGCWGGGVGVGR